LMSIGNSRKPQACAARAATFPLVLAGEGEEVCIRAIGGAPGFVRRLMDLGLRSGQRARVSQRNAAGLVLAVHGMRLAMDPAAARHVMVALCDECRGGETGERGGE